MHNISTVKCNARNETKSDLNFFPGTNIDMIFSDQDLLETFLQTEVHILYWDRENLPSDEVTTPLKLNRLVSFR